MMVDNIEFVEIARMGETAEGSAKLVRMGETDLALIRSGGKYYCCSNICPHQHRSELHLGSIAGTEIQCPVHGWTFSLETGKGEPGGRLKLYKVIELDGMVWVEKPKSHLPF